MLRIEDPPWFENPPDNIRAPTRIPVYRWFRYQPRPVCLLLTVNEGRTGLRSKSSLNTIRSFLKMFTAKSSNNEKERLLKMTSVRFRPAINHLVRDLLFAWFNRNANSFYARVFHSFLYVKWARLNEREYTRSRPPYDSSAEAIWRSDAQFNFIRELQKVFERPADFQPNTPAEWLIAADMLEEAGEIRAEAIRAVANDASDAEVIAAIYRALPRDLLP